MSYMDFYRQYTLVDTRRTVKVYVLFVMINVVYGIIMAISTDISFLLDPIVYGVLAMVVITRKSWVFALISVIWALIGCFLSFIDEGIPTGILVIIIGIITVIKLRKIRKAYNVFKKTGILPMQV